MLYGYIMKDGDDFNDAQIKRVQAMFKLLDPTQKKNFLFTCSQTNSSIKSEKERVQMAPGSESRQCRRLSGR